MLIIISKNFIIIFFLLYSNISQAINMNLTNDYTKYIFNSSFIKFEENDFTKLKLIQNIQNLNKDNLLFIYTPGSLNDDRADQICSTYNEFAYLSDFFFNFNQQKKLYFYLNCTNLIEGDLKIPNGINFPHEYQGKSKHFKIRKNLINLIEDFKKKRFKKEKIFLVGHSCGAWHSLFILSQNEEIANSVIAFSPACFGPRYLYWKREDFFKLRKNKIKIMKKNIKFSSLSFINTNDIGENYITLKWLNKINGSKLIRTMSNKNNYYSSNSQICKFHSDLDAKIQILADAHNLHFSKCFDVYTNEIASFINNRLN